jgi:hypothetical protein
MMSTVELRSFAPVPVELAGYGLGQPQRAGGLTVLPVFGPSYAGVVPPRSGIKLNRVDGYGRVELSNTTGAGVAIVPLHVGYIQDSAQNHALCRSAFLAAGQTLMFADAACVQESQGGYLAGREQWFFVLPWELRDAALASRGVADYAKLWREITAFNEEYGLPARGHLEQVLSRQRAVLTQYRSRLELVPQQLGALFFLRERLIGIEIAPDPRYFAEMWMALVCFAYGPAAWRASAVDAGAGAAPVEPFAVDTLEGLRTALAESRRATVEQVHGWLAQAPRRPAELVEEERYLGLRLSTVVDGPFGGQLVTDGERLVYASLYARAAQRV